MESRLREEPGENQKAGYAAAPPFSATTASLPPLTAESTADVAGIVAEVADGIAWQSRFTRWGIALPAGILALVGFSLASIHFRIGTPAFIQLLAQPAVMVALAVFLVGVPITAALAILTHAAKLSSHSRNLADMDDVQLIGPLIDLLGMENVRVRTHAMRALTRLLPRLTADNTECLTTPRRERLAKLVRMNPDFFLYKDLGSFLRPPTLDRQANIAAIDFRVAILESYARIGGTLELPTVRQLAESTSPNPAQVRLREAARAVLPAVEARAALQRITAQDGMLLRPAASGADSGILLQPADSAPVEPASLLRPAD